MKWLLVKDLTVIVICFTFRPCWLHSVSIISPPNSDLDYTTGSLMNMCFFCMHTQTRCLLSHSKELVQSALDLTLKLYRLYVTIFSCKSCPKSNSRYASLSIFLFLPHVMQYFCKLSYACGWLVMRRDCMWRMVVLPSAQKTSLHCSFYIYIFANSSACLYMTRNHLIIYCPRLVFVTVQGDDGPPGEAGLPGPFGEKVSVLC